jgi:pyruvate dehydrogenase E1 component alpha subunit
MNFANVFRHPVVWYCINSQFGMGIAVDRSAVSEMFRKACAYDMESIRVDGKDLLEVIRKTSEVVERTRQDSEPRLYRGRRLPFAGDPDKYRSDDGKWRWRDQDPVVRFDLQLVEHRVATIEGLAADSGRRRPPPRCRPPGLAALQGGHVGRIDTDPAWHR